jgi:diguanylate cyclase (GGDEF)-like protein
LGEFDAVKHAILSNMTDRKDIKTPEYIAQILAAIPARDAVLARQYLSEVHDELHTLQKENEQLSEAIGLLRRVDDLTGLANQHRMYEFLELEINRANRYRSELCICFIDIDYFKQVNTNFGHQVGSNILKKIGHFLKEQVRSLDLAVRFGGDEFVWILPQTNLEGALVAANRFRQKLSEQRFLTSADLDITINASIGVTRYRRQESAKAFIDRADASLRSAKADGRDRVLSSPATDEPITENKEIIEKTEQASREEGRTP